ncbi:GNAT family N-acetyltransferase [Kaistia sp. 32K]|uniref:GNAT family N-acetyltransferase n=1 Tax=Kaistia sp. 32K TaxID=2795690 RepID=UPI001916BB1E|nr:N-acetyltransferase [Kaistia sp. 32K]BCP53263.1 GNAT family N-acetyltransferase [Kaistia sp. 32K]
MKIRDEKPADREAINALVTAAFRDHPHSNQREAQLVDALRDAGALTISLVAEEAGTIVGHIAFSAVTIDGVDKGWFGLAPVAVLPALQGKGIGRALIEAGLERLQALGATGCVLVGDPGFYRRFGFQADSRLTYPGLPPEYFLARLLKQDGTKAPAMPSGEVRHHPAFTEIG